MKRLFAALALVACVGCGATPAPNTDPTRNLSTAGHAAYESTKIIKVLDLMDDVAMTGEAQTPKLFTTDTTTKVVRFHHHVVSAIGEIPNGWRPVLDQGLTDLQKELPDREWEQIAPYVALIRSLLAQGGK